MPKPSVTVELKARCFAALTVGGTPVELFVESLVDGKAHVTITSPKKIAALRTYQELPGTTNADDPLAATLKAKRA